MSSISAVGATLQLVGGTSDQLPVTGLAHQPIHLHLHGKQVTVERSAHGLGLHIPGHALRFVRTKGRTAVKIQLSTHHWLLVHRHTKTDRLHLRFVRISDDGKAFGAHVVFEHNGSTVHEHVTPKSVTTQPRPIIFGHSKLPVGWTYDSAIN